MSEFLLDTHAIYWAVQAPAKLPSRVRSVIQAGRVLSSVASFWEISIKSRKGALPIADAEAWWTRAIEALRVPALSVRTNHVAALNRLPEVHRDPFDRILIAQAVADGLTLITSDESIERYPVKVLWQG